MTSLKASPTMPTGIVPTMMYQPIRKSRWPRHSGFTRPSTQVRAICQMSRAKKRMTAAIAPIWITAVNPVTAGSSTWRPRIFSAIVRCPVLEMGRNSVRPSTMPRMIASR